MVILLIELLFTKGRRRSEEDMKKIAKMPNKEYFKSKE